MGVGEAYETAPELTLLRSHLPHLCSLEPVGPAFVCLLVLVQEAEVAGFPQLCYQPQHLAQSP